LMESLISSFSGSQKTGQHSHRHLIRGLHFFPR
jgi:hypothetical protein